MFLDIGCGDGRALVEVAARAQCQAIGLENDEVLVARARKLCEERGVSARVRVEFGR